MKKIERKLNKIDATDKSIGRLATQIAIILRGKDQPEFQPHIDNGGVVEVSNIGRVKFTGKKFEQKKYYSFSGYPGGLKQRKVSDIFQSKPEEILRRAVREMLPSNRLRNGMMKRLIVK